MLVPRVAMAATMEPGSNYRSCHRMRPFRSAPCLQMRERRVVEGIVWVWMGDQPPLRDPPMQGDLLDPVTGTNSNVFVNDFQIDLPYVHSYLVENLIDPAHIDIRVTIRTQGGGRRESAQAYEMSVDPDSCQRAQGFTGSFRFAAANADDVPWTELKFEAPGIIRYSTESPVPALALVLPSTACPCRWDDRGSCFTSTWAACQGCPRL